MKKFTAVVLAMLMVIGMVGNVCAEYAAGSIAAIVGSAIEIEVDVNADVKVKASGGISSLADAEKFIELGAERLGTSRIVKIAMAQEVPEGTY